jgi:serine/threonine-protein kinase
MAEVYLAMLEGPAGFSKVLVVKELRQDSLEDDVGIQMFLDEARVAARLNHPNIVQTLEVGSDGARCYLAMEYLDGQSLRRVIRRAKSANAPIPLQTHLRVLVDILHALAYAHSLKEFDGTPLGLVHRDVSPQNVIVTYEGHVKLIDFGIAKTTLASAETKAGMIKGKIKYMPPEQAMGQAVDERTDVFAVGVMLWEALVEGGPWQGDSDVEIFRKLISGAVPRLESVTPGLDPHLIAIVNRALSADPRDRYPTAAAMRDDLEASIAPCRTPHAPLRDLTKLLEVLFEKERRELHTLIEAWIRRPDSLPPEAVSLTRVRTETIEGTGSPSNSKLATTPRAYVSPIPPPPEVVLESTSRTPKSAVAIGAAAIAVVAATLAIAYLARSPSQVVPVAVETRPSAASAPPASTAVPSSRVDVRANPPWAQVYVDDQPVANPFSTDMPANGGSHLVRAEAPGYSTKTSTLVAGLDHDLQMNLEHQPLPPKPTLRPPGIDPTPRSVPGPLATPSVPSEESLLPAPSLRSPAPTPGRRKKHEVDKEDPYAQ